MWSLASAVSVNTNEETTNNVASWTPFNKEITAVQHGKALLEYLPVIPEAPEYKVCKDLLDYLCDLLKELEIGHIYAHADEQVYAKLAHIIWKYPKDYENLIILMSGFHQLRVLQRIIYKRHACKGYQSWWVNAGTIVFGSSENAFSGGHYYRNMRLHKESFNALVQFRAEKITSGFSEIDPNLKLKQLSSAPSPEAIEDVMVCPALELLVQKIVQVEDGTESRMTISYLRDVSLLLALVSAVREKDLSRHMQAEREMLSLCFAFDHINYARYMSFQHVNLLMLKMCHDPAFTELSERGFGGSLSGEKFSAIHGDLITEIYNAMHFLIPCTGGAFAPLGPFLCPTTEEKMAYCPKVRALGPVLSKRV